MGWIVDATVNPPAWMPECPMITEGHGKDGIGRLYIIAANAVDVDLMCRVAGIPSEGIRPGQWYKGYERIVKRHEVAALKRALPYMKNHPSGVV